MNPESCLYEGMIRHRRFEPIEHGFRNRIQLAYLDLAEIPVLFANSRLWSIEGRTPVSFRRADHLGAPDQPLADSVGDLVEARLGRRPPGPIRLLTSPRYLGLVFNPVSFYYCLDKEAESVDALVAEVTNTPWGERYCYVVDLSASGFDPIAHLTRTSDKQFHVSPFMEMEMQYEWRIGLPGRNLTLTIRSEIENRAPSSARAYGAPYFQADLALRRLELESSTLRSAFWREPLLSGRVLLSIYWQALRLAIRRVPYVPHPRRRWPRDFADPALMAHESASRVGGLTE